MPPSRKRTAKTKAVAVRPTKAPTARPRNRVDVLVQEGATLVRNYAHMETSKTTLLRELARVVVELRSIFATDDGRPDWSGRSAAYRDAIARIYRDAGLPPDSLDTMQAALRYHVGNVLRDVAPPEELEDLGLRVKRPVERVQETRERLAALARLGAASQSSGNRRADVLRLVAGAEAALMRVRDEDLAKVKPESVGDLVTSLEAILDRADELHRIAKPKPRGGRRRS